MAVLMSASANAWRRAESILVGQGRSRFCLSFVCRRPLSKKSRETAVISWDFYLVLKYSDSYILFRDKTMTL
jgi:hypothetical protein